MTEHPDEPAIPQRLWDAATDSTIPPGVIVLIDDNGTRHPMPLIEFATDHTPEIQQIIAGLDADEVALVLQLGTGRDSCPPWWSPAHDALLDRLRDRLRVVEG